MSIRFSVTDRQDAYLEAIGRNLACHNDAEVGPSGRQVLGVLARGDNGELIGGLSGYTAWGWLYTRWLWVDRVFRGRGIAGELLVWAEAEAQRRGCKGAHIDTFSDQAMTLYAKCGYQVFGEIPDFVDGRSRSFLCKRWSL